MSWEWNMGDNGSGSYINNTNSNSVEPVYTYADTGTFNVTLILIGPNCNDTITKKVKVWDNPKITTTNYTDIFCFGDSTGVININTFDGTPPYTYNWTSTNNFSSINEDIDSLPAGTYSVIVTDSNGCTVYDTIELTEPTEIILSSTNTNILCHGDSTGSIDLSVTGGVSPYTYQWSNGETTQDINNLTEGTYTVIVTDSNLCIDSLMINITQPDSIILSSVNTNILCHGDSTGSIDLSVTGGVSPYTYQWSNGETTQDINNLTEGTYTVIVTDSNGCTIYDTIVLTEPTDIIFSTTNTNILCHGDSTGSIDLSVIGGVSPYTYQWSNGETTQDINNLTEGTYSVIITDSNGCTVYDTIELTEPTEIILSSTNTNILCHGDSTGSIDLSVTGGVSPYTYQWSNGETTQDINNLTEGTYTVIVTDSNLCIDSLMINITQPDSIILSSVNTNILCHGDSTGSIDLSVTGGVSPYTYQWSNGETTQDINNLTEGTYTVIVTDSNGCTIYDTIVLTEPTDIIFSTTNTNILCHGDSTGSIDLSVIGGVSPYTYQWSNGETTQDINNLTEGTYSVIITDSNGCTVYDTIELTEPTEIILSSTNTNILCHGDSTGSIDLSVTGGVSPYTYQWSNGETTQDINNLTEGTYTVIVTDSNLCIDSLMINITQPDSIILSSVNTNILCHGDSTGSIDLSVTGGVSPYTYQWSNGETTQDINNLTEGTYTVIVTDSNGCTIYDTIVLTEPQFPLSMSIVNDTICSGDSNGFIDLTVNGGVNPYTYQWSNGDTTQDISNLTEGTYTVIVTDSNGCIYNDSGYIISRPNPTAVFTSNTVLVNTPTIFYNTSYHTPPLGGNNLTYNWIIPCAGLIDNTTTLSSENPIFTFYDCDTCMVELIVTDQFNCDDTTIVPVANYCLGNAEFIADSVCQGEIIFYRLINS